MNRSTHPLKLQFSCIGSAIFVHTAGAFLCILYVTSSYYPFKYIFLKRATMISSGITLTSAACLWFLCWRTVVSCFQLFLPLSIHESEQQENYRNLKSLSELESSLHFRLSCSYFHLRPYSWKFYSDSLISSVATIGSSHSIPLHQLDIILENSSQGSPSNS